MDDDERDELDDVIGDPDNLPPEDEYRLSRRPGVVSGRPYSEETQ
jgi:hypothetical protein